MSRERYLIYSPALSQSLALVRLLRRHRPDAILAGVTLPGEGLGGAGRAYDAILPAAEARAGEGDVVVPTGVESTMYLAQAGEVALGDSLLTAEALRFIDKPWSLDLAARNAVPVPATWRNAAEVERWPVFYKSAVEGETKLRGIAAGAGDLPDGNVILQEVIRGEGVHALGFLAHNGEIVASHGHHEVASYPELGGSAAILERRAEPRVEALTRALVRASNYSGWGLAEFKHCPSRDDFVFMEVNAKLWASWEMALLNEPAFARTLFGIAIEPAGIERMVFVERALRRGPRFWPAMVRAMAGGAIARAYPGWPRQVAAALTPPFLFPLAKRLASG